MKSAILFLTISLYSAFAFAQDCNSITVTGVNGQINISGVSGAPIATVQVFNSSWTSIFNQTYNNHNGSTIVVAPLTPGQYFVNVRLYNSNWTSICEKGVNATVPDGPPPPPPAECGPTFQKTFGMAAGNDESISIRQTLDGGYVAVGHSAASGSTNYDAHVMKFDSKGNRLWSKTLGSAQHDYFTEVAPVSDGGFIAAGTYNGSGPLGTYTGDAWVVRFDVNGNIIWQKRYVVGGDPGHLNGIIQTSDGGFAFVGTFPFSPGVADVMVVKVDASGNIQWQKKLASGNSDSGQGIVEDDHGGSGLVVTAVLYSTTYYDAVITKLNMSGGLMWTKAYDFDSRNNWIRGVYKVADGFVFNILNTTGWEVSEAKPGILKTNFNGEFMWAKEYNAPAVNREGKMCVLPDGSFMLSQAEVPVDAASNLHMMRINSAGNLMWAKRYPNPGAQWLNTITNDGYFTVGAGFSTVGSFKDALIQKMDQWGKLGTCDSTTVAVVTRNCNMTPVTFTYPVNTALNFTAVNTTVATATFNPVQNIICAENCSTTVTIGNVTVSENAGTASIQVCLSAPATSTQLFSYTTSDGSATSGSDYTGGAGTVTIAAGQTCGTINIPILNDANIESTETFTVSIGSATGTVTINDDDQPQGNCNGVTITPGSNQITITGVTAALATVQVFNSSWATVFNQTYNNAPGTVNVPIAPGTYLVKVTFYTANWGYICDKSENVTVINQCPAGMICISNICPETTVDLYDAYSIPNLPAGTTVTWHTGSPATDANKLTEEQARNVSASGTYYAAVYISGSGCYSSTIAVSVTINPCAGGEVSPGTTLTEKANMVQLKSADQPSVRNITVFPNPFARTLRVVIDSEKSEKATIALMDVRGKELKQVSVQLSPGSNAVLLEGLDRYPSGNYFLKINSASGTKTMKVMRGQ